jgi:hypothetical protein
MASLLVEWGAAWRGIKTGPPQKVVIVVDHAAAA